MAGHVRTIAGKGRFTGTTGRVRRNRVRLPAEDIDPARRTKQRTGARTRAQHRLDNAQTPQEQLDAAREYLLSAMAKYDGRQSIPGLVQLMLRAGDRIYATGRPVTPETRKRSQQRAAANRSKRRTNRLLVAEGLRSVWNQRNPNR
uniref:hypothetical protein n=1 Tax=Amycolatopsis sp. CA-096443 TaxID=3239919 RepID=UPI003F495B1A